MTMTITDTMVDNTVTGTLTVLHGASYVVTGTMVDNTVTGTINEE